MKKVYIVDDDKSIVESLSIVLKSAGYEIGCQNDTRTSRTTHGSSERISSSWMSCSPRTWGPGFEVARSLKGTNGRAGSRS